MAADDIIQRIHGSLFSAGAHRPFFLDDPERVVFVQQGYLDIFVVEVAGGEVATRQPHVTRIPAGEMAFGAEKLRGAAFIKPNDLAFLAVPSQDAVLIEGRRAGLTDKENFDLEALIWIDNWLFRLSEFLVRGGEPLPRDAVLLEADPDVPYPAGSVVSAHHSDVIWVSANRPMRFAGREMLPVEAGEIQPLSERTWFALDEDTQVTAAHTPSVFVSGRLWPAFDRHSRLVLDYVNVSWTEKSAAAKERYRASLSGHEAARSRMFQHLGGVLGAAEERRVPEAAAHASLPAAAQIVAESIGASLDLPRDPPEGSDAAETIMQLAAPSGVRARRIALAPGWWRRDGPSFVGFTAEGERPLALLADGRGRYRSVDPQTGASAAVNRARAARIASGGVVLYPPLPARIESGMAALLHVLRRHRRDIRTVLSMAIAGALFALLIPILTGQLLAEIIPRVDVPMWVASLGALLLGTVGGTVFRVVQALALLRVEGRVGEDLQSAVWSRLLSLPVPFFRNFAAGELADRANGIFEIRQLLTNATVGAVSSGIFAMASYLLMFYYSWPLALCVLALLFAFFGMSWIFARGQMKHYRAAFRTQGIIDGLVFQMITGIAKLRVANAENYALARWAERFAEQKYATLAARRWAAAQFTFNSMFVPLSSLGLVAFIWYALIAGGQQPDFDLAAFLSFNAAFGQLAAAVTGLTAAWTIAVVTVPLFERVQPIFESAPESADGGEIAPKDLTGDIEFVNVTFRYLPEAPNALDGVSFHIRPGDYVAFVGASGSGKSTIYRLILGFERPASGTVFLDGYDLLSLDLPRVRSRMGVVLQNGQLIPESIFKNISSSAALTLEEAWAAARAAGIDEDIRAMPMGMHTVLSEGAGGGSLSGGQKQRLLIARALARKPRIVLFDEATSALDNRTQAIVQASLNNLSITRVVIAHRLTTVQDADRIFVLEAGRVVESGRYRELMERGGAFASLAKRQMS